MYSPPRAIRVRKESDYWIRALYNLSGTLHTLLLFAFAYGLVTLYTDDFGNRPFQRGLIPPIYALSLYSLYNLLLGTLGKQSLRLSASVKRTSTSSPYLAFVTYFSLCCITCLLEMLVISILLKVAISATTYSDFNSQFFQLVADVFNGLFFSSFRKSSELRTSIPITII